MTRKAMILGAALLAATAVTVAAVAATTGKDPVGTPTPERFDEKQWVIETPDGWVRKVITPDADARKAIRYEGPNGEFFIVAIDPLGSGYAYDARWTYKVNGDRFELIDQVGCTSATDESCSDDDDRYDGVILWKTGTEPVKVGGHTFYFLFGNAEDTTVDAEVFEEILDSIRVA